jgi:hypothetical protein
MSKQGKPQSVQKKDIASKRKKMNHVNKKFVEVSVSISMTLTIVK